MRLTLFQITQLGYAQRERLYAESNLALGLHRTAHHGQQKDVRSFMAALKPERITNQDRQGRSSPSLGVPDGFVHVEKPE